MKTVKAIAVGLCFIKVILSILCVLRNDMVDFSSDIFAIEPGLAFDLLFSGSITVMYISEFSLYFALGYIALFVTSLIIILFVKKHLCKKIAKMFVRYVLFLDAFIPFMIVVFFAFGAANGLPFPAYLLLYVFVNLLPLFFFILSERLESKKDNNLITFNEDEIDKI